MTAILFGSISTLADTSELQREAFNEAFAQHSLDWVWNRDEYRSLLESNGGAQRIADYADEHGDDVDAEAVHATKSDFAQVQMRRGLEPRPGVAETIAEARRQGFKVGLVTTTAQDNVDAMLYGLSEIDADFDVVLAADDVAEGKPAPAVYTLALERLGESAGGCVAIEDNIGGVRSAQAAGIPCVAFPNSNTADHDFAEAGAQLTQLDFASVSALVAES